VAESVEWLAFTSGDVDAHGNTSEGYADPVTLDGFGFDPGSSSEPREPGSDRVIVEPTLYGPYDAPFGPRDRVIVRGLTYEVEGEVRRWRNMFSNRAFGSVTSLRRVDG
jgi:hypothetical protein